MRTLYESILSSDFDVDEDSIIRGALQSVLDDAVYDEHFDGTFELVGNVLYINWNGSDTREILFDELYKGLKDVPREIKAIYFGKSGTAEAMKNVLLHFAESIDYCNLTVSAQTIQAEGYAISSRPIEIKFKNFIFIAPRQILFRCISPRLVGKSRIDSDKLTLTMSHLITSKQTSIHTTMISYTAPPQKVLQKLKKIGARPLDEKVIANVNPFDALFGCKKDEALRKITIIIDEDNQDSLAFVWRTQWEQISSRKRAQNHFSMKDDWSVYTGLISPWVEITLL